MKIDRRTFLSFFIYAISVASFIIADFYVVSIYPAEAIAEWAFYKSLIFIFGGMCVLGFDQLLLREVEYYHQFKQQFLLQSIFISIIVSSILILYTSSVWKSFFCFFMLFFYSNFMFEAGYWRGKKDLVLSQLNTNLWKFFVFLSLLTCVIVEKNMEVIDIYFYSLLLAFLILFLINFKKNTMLKSNKEKELTIQEKMRYSLLGFYFFIHSFSLVIANYGEQFFINLLGDEKISSIIFSYITIYSSLVLAVIGFLGFYLGPKVRYQKKFTMTNYYKYLFVIVMIGFITLFINSGLIYLFYSELFNDTKFDLWLWLLILILTFCRVLYVVPSLCLGVFGDVNSLKKSSIYNIMVMIVYIVTLIILLNAEYKYTQYAVVALMIFHWLSKVVISHYYVFVCLVNKTLESERV